MKIAEMEEELLKALNSGRCPDCDHDRFLRGPEAGIMTNIKCAGCGSEFNYCPPCAVASHGIAERIGEAKPCPQVGARLKHLWRRIENFQQRNFPEQTLGAKLVHLRHELKELIDAPHDETEWADVFILLLGSASKRGLTIEQLLEAAHRKMDVNNLRRWSAPDADGVYHHEEEAR